MNLAIISRETVKLAYFKGLVIEPSGAAALAAVLTGKVKTIKIDLKATQTKLIF